MSWRLRKSWHLWLTKNQDGRTAADHRVHHRASARRFRNNPLFTYPCPIQKGGTTGGTNRGTKRVHLRLYPLPVPPARYRRVFPRQFAPPLVGRAARLRPPSRALDTHSTQLRAGQRPRSPPCPIGLRLLRTRLSAEVGQHALSTCHHRGHPRQVVGPRGSTRPRIDAQASPPIDPDNLPVTTSLPVDARNGQCSDINARPPKRRARRQSSLSPTASTMAACGRTIATRVRAFRTESGTRVRKPGARDHHRNLINIS